MTQRSFAGGFATILAIVFLLHAHPAGANRPAATNQEAVLTAHEIGTKLFPEKVFFRGQLAPVQLRNTGGVHFADDFYALAALCDNGGYSTQIREKFQGYLLTEVSLAIGGQTLKPGAYGFGFLTGGQFVVMDLGANDLFKVSSARDADMKRPVPLQVVAGERGGYRLYAGRDYVEWRRSQ